MCTYAWCETGNWWQATVQETYPEAGSAETVTVSKRLAPLTGLAVSGKVSETRNIDIHGNMTRTQAFIDRANKSETRITRHPDSDTTARRETVNGLLVSARSRTGITMTYTYDALGRRTGSTHPRKGATLTHYNEAGRVDYTEDAANNRTTYTYDPRTGRKIAETNFGCGRWPAFERNLWQVRSCRRSPGFVSLDQLFQPFVEILGHEPF